jgi:Flp pilus assembly protein CpaB
VAAAALLAARAQAEAARGERARWDATVEVVVARDDLAPGDRATGDDLAVELRPAALVPDDALRALPDLPAVVGQAIASGEVVIGRRLGPEGTAASLPAGHAAVTISVSGRLPALSPGDRVDLLAAPPAVEPGSAAPRATLVARDAVVLEADDGGDDGLLASTGSGSSVTVAVADGDLGTAAAAALAGPVAVAVRSGS